VSEYRDFVWTRKIFEARKYGEAYNLHLKLILQEKCRSLKAIRAVEKEVA